MILTAPLQPGTLLANVRYEWIAFGVEGPVLSAGITQPSVDYPVFRLNVIPPVGAEELIAFDVTNQSNWNAANYAVELFSMPAGLHTSPNLARLRTVCAAYLRRDPSEFVINGVDLFLIAANNARSGAEMMHDFEYSRVVATLDLTAAGARLADATIVEGVATKGVRQIVAARRLGTNGYFYPLDFTRGDIAQERDRSELELRDDYWVSRRYPSDADVLNFYGTNTSIVQRGGRISLYPGFSGLDPQSVTIYLDGYGWLPDYGSTDEVDAPEDFIVDVGFSYLQWAIICELNTMFQTFVPRQEGNLPPPTAERDAEFKQLVLWDNYLVDSSVTRSA